MEEIKREKGYGVTLSDESVKRFEDDQKEHGTQVAIFNLIFLLCDSIMRNLGDVGKVSVEPKEIVGGSRRIV